MELKILDLMPAYIPFQIQILGADGTVTDPSAITLTIYEEDGVDGTYGTTQVTGSPFTPVKIASQTGFYGKLIDKTVFTAGKAYLCLWNVTVEGVATVKQESFLACSNLPAQVKAIDDIDFPATMKAAINTEVDSALNTAIPGSPTPDSINERIATLDTDVTAIKGAGFNTDNDSLHILRNRGDEYWATGDIGSVPTVGDIVAGVEEAGTKLDAVFQTVGAFLDQKISSMASLGDGNTTVTFEVTEDATTLPVADVLVQVRATNDETADVIASGYTNDSGQVSFSLNVGVTYYYWRRKAGMTFTGDPVEFTVE